LCRAEAGEARICKTAGVRNPVLSAAALPCPRHYRVGPGQVSLRGERKGCAAEASIRPLLHSKRVADRRLQNPASHRENHSLSPGQPLSPGSTSADRLVQKNGKCIPNGSLV